MNPLFLDFKMKTAAGTQLWAKTGKIQVVVLLWIRFNFSGPNKNISE